MWRHFGFALSFFLLLGAGFSPTASATADGLEARLDWSNSEYRVKAVLRQDPVSKRIDLWVHYLEGVDEGKQEFKATSIERQFKYADYRLEPAKPVQTGSGMELIIYDAYDLKSGRPNPNRGMALLIRYPITALNRKTASWLLKQFPQAIIRDARNRPTHIKAILARVTEYQVYPIGAFDASPAPQIPLAAAAEFR